VEQGLQQGFRVGDVRVIQRVQALLDMGARWPCGRVRMLNAVLYPRRPLLPEAVYRLLTLLCRLVLTIPVGTHLGLLHLLWMVVSGQWLATRGAVIPGLSACGLSERAVLPSTVGDYSRPCKRLLC
jgi:hypothetical protein